jgi:hypothetical protein
MYLIHESPSTDRLSIVLGFERTWARNILKRANGWFKDTLFLSFKPVNESLVSLITLEQLKELVTELTLKTPRTSSFNVKITNTKKGEILFYSSIKSAVRDLNADEASISVRLKG